MMQVSWTLNTLLAREGWKFFSSKGNCSVVLNLYALQWELPCGFLCGIGAAGRPIPEKNGTAVLHGILLVLSH